MYFSEAFEIICSALILNCCKPPTGDNNIGEEIFFPKNFFSIFRFLVSFNTRGTIPIFLKISLFLIVVWPYSAEPSNHFQTFGLTFFFAFLITSLIVLNFHLSIFFQKNSIWYVCEYL